MPNSRSRSAKANGPGAPGAGMAGGAGSSGSTATIGTVIHGFSISGRQQTKATRPPGRNPRADVGERRDRILEEHHPEAREGAVDRLEGVDLGVGLR